MLRLKKKPADPLTLVASPQRLAAVRRTGLLDTPPEPAFDQLTELAAEVIGAPASFLCLVDEHRVFYKSVYGFDALRSRRELQGITFCHYAILGERPLVLHDTSDHPVFRTAPASLELGVASYAGVPLRGEDGLALGAFSVVDVEPRTWTTRDVGILEKMAGAAGREIRLSMATRELREKAEENRRAAMTRQEFLARVAHDLRNPLSSASVGIALLEYARLTKRERQTLQTTRKILESMNAIVGDLLSVSQLESGKFHLHCSPVSCTSLLGDAREILSGLADSKGISLQVIAPAPLPVIEADYERLLRVFSNLVGNAIKFCEAGSTVRMSAERRGDRVRFLVVDDGPGIPPESIGRLFDRFWQSDASDQRGLGLGLSIVKAIVEAHGGEVGVESTLGQGAVFWFTLPLAAGWIPDTPEAPASPAGG